MEYLTLLCRPFWLLREFTAVIITAVYTAVLDHCYSPFRDAYKSLPRPAFGKSDLSSVLLLPANRQKLKREAPTLRTFQSWSDQSDSSLQDCFEHVDWEIFRAASDEDIEVYTLHTALSHLDSKNTHARMLFLDYSSAFNTIVPTRLIMKLQTLGLNESLCSWILDFLSGRCQVVRVGNITSSPLVLNTGAPQGCILSPLLYSLYTYDCTATHSSTVIVKFANDTTVVGLITEDDETAYREEVYALTRWCLENHL